MYYIAIERGENNLQLETLQPAADELGAALWGVFRDAR